MPAAISRNYTSYTYKPSFEGYGGIPISHVNKWVRAKKFPYYKEKRVLFY